MKAMMRKMPAIILTLVMVMSLFPATGHAYVGAMTKDAGGVTAGQQDGYKYLKNDYIGFYIRPDGNLTTAPSQKTLTDVKNIGPTEIHIFCKQTGPEIWRTDFNTAVGAGSSSVTIEAAGTANPKLKQTLTVSGRNAAVTITYELVQLDAGAAAGTVGQIIEEDPDDSGRTWGVLASASGNFPDVDTRELWMTRHNNFGGVVHSLPGAVRLSRFKKDDSTVTYYSALISSGLSREETLRETDGISEAFTDSFSYANQFVAMQGYMNAAAWGWDGTQWVGELISGIRGHWNNYASAVSYSPGNSSHLNVEHEFSGDNEAHALWGFRDLYAIGEGNIPADPVSIATDATCVGIINNNGTLSAYAAENEAALKSSYGDRLVAVFRGTFKQESGGFVFTNGAAQLSPSLTATWTEGSGGLTVAANGTVTAKNVHLSAPTFKFYKPKNGDDTSLTFDFSGGKLAVGIIPDNNAAILHIDIPGATCSVEGVTADRSGVLVFSGEMSISTPALDAANITMTRLGMGWNNNRFSLAGVEASGAVDMQQLLGLDVGSAAAEINSFPGEERYAFELELNVFDMFEAAGELELKRISNGALIPNTLEFKAASEAGVPLVPPVVVAEFNGLGGGFKNLADTINGDFFAIPPLRLTVSAKGSVLEIIEGWYTILIGAGYYKSSLTDGTLLEMDIVDEYSWYTELSGDIRSYGGMPYKGLKVGGGMGIDLSIPSDMPFIKAGGEFNASAFAGLDNYTNPTRAYLVLGADGKIYGLVQIPADAWPIDRDLKLANAELAFALGGQTVVPVSNTTFENAVKDAFGNISGYGGVAYTSSLIGWPYRIYYIFQDKKVDIEVGKWLGELDPFDPNPYSASKLPLLAAASGEQIGIMVMNDNLTLLGSSRAEGTGVSLLSVGTNDAAGNGVTITQDVYGQSYQVDIADTAPDPRYLVFSLKPDEGSVGSFVYGLTVQKSGESALNLVAAEFDNNGEITNSDSANMILGDDCVTLKLPSKGTWTISSAAAAFDISCYYASPYASLDGMSLSGAALSGTVKDMDSATNYVLRTYLGTAKGGTDYLLCQSDAPASGDINETLSLSGGAAPTGSYYVTTVLLEKISDDFDGDGTVEAEEVAYVTTDTYEFDTTVNYTNSEQPDQPTDVSLSAIGSELMRVQWKAPAAGPGVDGYFVRLYQQDGSDWTETGANYLLKAADLTTGADGCYTHDMAVTVGDKTLHLEADKTYRAGITAFRYLADEDGDGTNDSLPVESSEAQSGGSYLPQAIYPVLSYSPVPASDGDSIKLLFIKGATEITVTSDVYADIVVTRMDTDTAVPQTPTSDRTLTFDTPADFTGALNLKITATDAEGDITVDYLGLRLDDTAPLITPDSASFRADRDTGAFTASGVTENRARVTVTHIITGSGTNGANLDANEVTADENGAFTITGRLNPEDPVNELSAADSATLLLCARDAAGNVSDTFAQIVRAKMTANDITGFTVAGQVGASTIDTANHTVAFHMPNGTNVTALAPTITVSAGATINPASGTAQNFSSPVVYTVTAEDGTQQAWTVTCTEAVITSATISPATAAFDKNPANQADVITTITWNDATSVAEIKKDGISIGAAVYTVSGDTLTIKKKYLATQPTGSLALTVEFDKGNAAALTIDISDTTPAPVAPSYTLTTTVDPAGSGTVELNPAGGAYPAETSVTLAAYAAEGYAFDHWSGDLSGNANPATITMEANKNVTAHFVVAPAQPDLTVTNINTPDSITAGSAVTVTATVANTGAAGASNFDVTLYAGADPVETQNVASLSAGANTNVNFTWTPAAAGEVTLKAVADSGNAIVESNETNNELTKTVTVKPVKPEPCFIATAAYGSYLDHHVQTLREFRNDVLMKFSLGRALVSLYYNISPPLADFIAQYDTLKTVTRAILTPVVYSVAYPKISGIILLLLLAGSALLIFRIRKKTVVKI